MLRSVSWLALLVILPPCQLLRGQQSAKPPSEQSPSLAETEKWLTQTFTSEHTGAAFCNVLDPAPSQTCIFNSYKLQLDGCNVKLLVSHSHSDIEVSKNIVQYSLPDPRLDFLMSFKLSDIDPTTIRAREPIGIYGPLGKKMDYYNNDPEVGILFRTSGDADTMVWSKPDGTSPDLYHECCDVGIYMQPEYAPRFVKALRHAVELCGGKPSAF